MSANNLDLLLTTAEVARLARCHPRNINRRVQMGQEPQPVYRKGPGAPMLFRRADVLRWLGLAAPEQADTAVQGGE